MMNKYKQLILSIIGFLLSCLYIWHRFFRIRLPKDIPMDLSLNFFIILLVIIIFHIFIIIKIIIKVEPTFSMDFLYTPFKAFYTIIINKYEHLYTKTIDILIHQGLKSIDNSKIINHMIYLPQVIIVCILYVEIFIIGKIKIFYIVLMALIIPIIYKIGIFMLKDFFDTQCRHIDTHMAIQWNNPPEYDNNVDYKLIDAANYVKERFYRDKDSFDISFSLYFDYLNTLRSERNSAINIRAVEDYEISILDDTLQKVYSIIINYTAASSSFISYVGKVLLV